MHTLLQVILHRQVPKTQQIVQSRLALMHSMMDNSVHEFAAVGKNQSSIRDASMALVKYVKYVKYQIITNNQMARCTGPC